MEAQEDVPNACVKPACGVSPRTRPVKPRSPIGHQFVTGTRNIVAVAWDPATRAIYAAQHGRDAVNTLWPDYYNEDANAELPSEELFRLTAGTDFGWPFCYHDRFQGKKVLAPEYGGDGREVGRCAESGAAARRSRLIGRRTTCSSTTASSIRRAVVGVFVVFHGSWNPRSNRPGIRSRSLPRAGGEFTGRYETFAAGFAVTSPLLSPQDAVQRPVGIAQGPDGSRAAP